MKVSGAMEFSGIRGRFSTDISYESALNECFSAKYDALSRSNMIEIGNAAKGLAECYRRLGRIKDAENEYTFSLDVFSECKYLPGIVWAMWAKSNLLRQQCKFHESIDLLRSALNKSAQINDLKCNAYILAGIAENTRIVGNYKLAYIQHLNALRLFIKLNDYRGITWAYEGIAQMHKNLNHMKKGLNLFIIARDISRDIKDVRGLGYALKGTGEILGYLGNYRESIENLSFAKMAFKTINFKVGLAYTYKTFGDIYLNYGRYDEAISNLNKAKRIFEQSNDMRGLSYVQKSTGDYLSNVGLDLDAAKNYKDSLTFFRNNDVKYGIVQSTSSLINVCERNDMKELILASAS